MDKNVTTALTPEIVGTPQTPEVIEKPSYYLPQRLKDALLLLPDMDFDIDATLLKVGYSNSNITMARKRFMDHAYVKRWFHKHFENDKKFAKSEIVRYLRETLSAHSERAKHDVMHCGALVKLSEVLIKLLGLNEESDTKATTLEDLIQQAKGG